MAKEDLDAGIDLIGAINAGVVQAITRRGYEQVRACPACESEHKSK